MTVIQKRNRVRDISAGHTMKEVTNMGVTNADMDAIFSFYEGRFKDKIPISFNAQSWNWNVTANARCSVPKSYSFADPMVKVDNSLIPAKGKIGVEKYSISAAKQQPHIDFFTQLWTDSLINDFGIVLSPITERVVTHYGYDVMSDVVVKNYHKLQADGEFVFNPCSHLVIDGEFEYDEQLGTGIPSLFTSIQAVDSPEVFCDQWTSASYNLSHNLGVARPHLSGFSTTEIQDILDACTLESVESDTAGVSMSIAKSEFTNADLDLLITAAEGPETFMTIFRLVQQARDILKSIKTGKWKQYAPKLWRKLKRKGVSVNIYTSAKYSADIWLEMRYAIRPIYYDIVGLLKVLSDQKPLIGNYKTFRGFNSEEGFDEHQVVGLVGQDRPGDIVVYNSYSVEARSGILADVLLSSSNVQRLGLGNIGSLIWDATTLSFVVGWFIDIGQLLYDFNASAMFSERARWTTVKTTCLISGYKVSTLDNSTRKVAFELYVEKTERTIDPDTRYFILDVKLDVPKLIDIASLLLSLRTISHLSGR